MGRKSIALVSFTFFPENNGVANVVLQQATHFLEHGYEVHIITRTGEGREDLLKMNPGLIIHEFSVSGAFKIYDFYRGDVCRYVKFLNDLAVDVVLFHCWQMWTTDLFLLTSKRKVRYKAILVSHGTSFNSKYSTLEYVRSALLYPYRWIIQALITRFDKVVVLSDQIDKDRFYDSKILKDIGLLAKKVVIPNFIEPVDTGLLTKNICSKYDLEENAYFINVSNYQSLKNQELAIEAHSKMKTDVDLVFVGSYETKYLAKIKKVAAKSNKVNRVHFLVGIPRSDSLALVRNSKAFILTSKTECLPLTILESAGFGVPVLSTNVGAVRSIGGVTVFNNILELTELMAAMVSDQSFYLKKQNDMVMAALNFEKKAVMQRYLKLIEEVCCDT